MNGPVDFSRQMMAVERLLADPTSWDGLDKAFAPAKVADNFDPGDDMKMMLAAFAYTAEGRKIIEWLADLTCRAPYPQTGNSIQSAALAAAKHEARAAVGSVIMRAIADGEKLLGQKRSQNDAKPS